MRCHAILLTKSNGEISLPVMYLCLLRRALIAFLWPSIANWILISHPLPRSFVVFLWISKNSCWVDSDSDTRIRSVKFLSSWIIVNITCHWIVKPYGFGHKNLNMKHLNDWILFWLACSWWLVFCLLKYFVNTI